MSSQPKKIRCLERMADFLANKIAMKPEHLTPFEREELGALMYAIDICKKHIEQEQRYRESLRRG